MLGDVIVSYAILSILVSFMFNSNYSKVDWIKLVWNLWMCQLYLLAAKKSS